MLSIMLLLLLTLVIMPGLDEIPGAYRNRRSAR